MNLKLKAQRALKHKIQEEVAKFIGISLTSYSQKELGKKEFTETELMKIKIFLEMDDTTFIETFFTGDLPKL